MIDLDRESQCPSYSSAASQSGESEAYGGGAVDLLDSATESRQLELQEQQM